MKARTLIYDIETAPNISLTWGIYDQNVPKVVQQGYVFGFAYKWLGSRKVHSCYIWDYDGFTRNQTNDRKVAEKWLEVVNQADVVVGHNSISFDNKIMMAAVMRHRLPPPEPFANFDTKNSIKQVAKFDSNKLDDLGERFGIGRKMKHEGIELWWKCMQNDPIAQNKMVRYNKQDVKLTEDLYLYERPYARTHPAMNVLSGRPSSCQRCGGIKMNAGMKYRATNTNLYQYFRCMDCGGMAKSRIPEPNLEKVAYTN